MPTQVKPSSEIPSVLAILGSFPRPLWESAAKSIPARPHATAWPALLATRSRRFVSICKKPVPTWNRLEKSSSRTWSWAGRNKFSVFGVRFSVGATAPLANQRWSGSSYRTLKTEHRKPNIFSCGVSVFSVCSGLVRTCAISLQIARPFF